MVNDDATYSEQQERLDDSKTPLQADQHILRGEIFQVQRGIGGHETNNCEKKSAANDPGALPAALKRKQNMSKNFKDYTRRNQHRQELQRPIRLRVQRCLFIANVEQRRNNQYKSSLNIKERVLIKNCCLETAEQNGREQNKAELPNDY
jgi:hypothetical protein